MSILLTGLLFLAVLDEYLFYKACIRLKESSIVKRLIVLSLIVIAFIIISTAYFVNASEKSSMVYFIIIGVFSIILSISLNKNKPQKNKMRVNFTKDSHLFQYFQSNSSHREWNCCHITTNCFSCGNINRYRDCDTWDWYSRINNDCARCGQK